MGKIGERLREERELLKLSPEAFANLCGVGKSAQYRYESDERSPDGEYFGNAADLGVDILYVLTGIRGSLKALQDRAAYSPAQRLAEFIASLKLSEEDAGMLKVFAERLAK